MNYSDFLDEEEQEHLSIKATRGQPQIPTRYDTLHTILKILRIFHDNYDKKLNLEKLFNILNIPVQEREEYINIILQFQKLFRTTFQSHFLELKEINSSKYLICKNSKHPSQNNMKTTHIPQHITISPQNLSLLNDIVYMFTNVKRGKGFDLTQDSSELVKGIKTLRKRYPYLFFSNGHGYVYPTEFGIKLGVKVNAYLKSNRPFEPFIVEQIQIMIE